MAQKRARVVWEKNVVFYMYICDYCIRIYHVIYIYKYGPIYIYIDPIVTVSIGITYLFFISGIQLNTNVVTFFISNGF